MEDIAAVEDDDDVASVEGEDDVASVEEDADVVSVEEEGDVASVEEEDDVASVEEEDDAATEAGDEAKAEGEEVEEGTEVVAMSISRRRITSARRATIPIWKSCRRGRTSHLEAEGIKSTSEHGIRPTAKDKR